MKNKKAQIEPIPLLMGVAGGIFGWFLAGQMDAGIVLKIIAALATMVVGYVIAYLIMQTGG